MREFRDFCTQTRARSLSRAGVGLLLAGGLILSACSSGARLNVDDTAGAPVRTWIPFSPEGNAPAAGEDCAAIYDARRDRIVLFGGKNDHNENLNETWMFDLKTSRWANITSKELNPPPREDHVVIYDPVGDRMILHGGEANEWTENGTWALDLGTLEWQDITTDDAPHIEDHTAVYDSKRKRMVVYGGRRDEHVNLTTIYALDLDPSSTNYLHWQELEQEGKHMPPGRVDHVAIYDPVRDRMVIFGGWDKENDVYLEDTWAFDFEKMAWKAYARKAKNIKPPARRHAVAAYDSQNEWMVVFGGSDGGLLNDIWAFNLKDDEWINLTPGPEPRTDHVAVFDPRSGRVVIYGGETIKGGAKQHDLWQFYPGIATHESNENQ